MTAPNPYQTPDAPLSIHQQQPIATRGRRLVNLLVDYVGIYAFSFAVGVAIYMTGMGDLLENVNELLFGILITLSYYVPQEAITGRTLGKLISGTRVIRENGDPVGWGDALIRALVRLVPFEAFSFLGKERPQGWHDSWSGTRVVSLREAPQPPEAAEQAPVEL